jgi:hypothetical protein
MKSLRWAILLGMGAWLSVCGVSAWAQPESGAPTQETGEEKDPKAKPMQEPLNWENLKLPRNAFIIIPETFKDAAKLIPNMIALSPEALEQLRADIIQQYKQKLKTEPTVPRQCQMKGKMVDGIAVIEADFIVETNQPDVSVNLGFANGSLTRADGSSKCLLLPGNNDGYVLQVPEPGRYQYRLELQVPVVVRRLEGVAGGTEYTLALGLAGAPIQQIDWELPAAIKEVRWNKDIVEKYPNVQGDNAVWTITLGKIKDWKLVWKEPAPQPTVAGRLGADWKITTRLSENRVVTTARLTLDDPNKDKLEVKLIVPVEAAVVGRTTEVKILGENGMLYPPDHNPKTGIVEVKGPASVQPMEIVITVTELRSPKEFFIGPFLVAGVSSQPGTIEIRADPGALRGKWLKYTRLTLIHITEPTRH